MLETHAGHRPYVSTKSHSHTTDRPQMYTLHRKYAMIEVRDLYTTLNTNSAFQHALITPPLVLYINPEAGAYEMNHL